MVLWCAGCTCKRVAGYLAAQHVLRRAVRFDGSQAFWLVGCLSGLRVVFYLAGCMCDSVTGQLCGRLVG